MILQIVRTVRLLLLGLWLGGAIFFGAAVAPSLFVVLRGAQLSNANEIAGTIVTRLLPTINIAGFVVALFLIATASAMQQTSNRFVRFAEMISRATIAIITAVSQCIVSTAMLPSRR